MMVRDARAVAASHLHASRQNWGSDWAAKNAYEAATRWHSYTAAAQTWHQDHPETPFLVVRYEDALSDPIAVLEEVLAFVLPAHVPPNSAQVLKNFEAQQTTIQDPKGFARVRGIEGWKQELTLWQKLVVWRYTRKKMREFGYDIGLNR